MDEQTKVFFIEKYLHPKYIYMSVCKENVKDRGITVTVMLWAVIAAWSCEIQGNFHEVVLMS